MELGSRLLLAVIVSVFFLSLTLNLVFFPGLPVGWDGFYHLRVLELTKEQQKFVPYDPISAGGRLQTYPPGYYALFLPVELLTGATPEAIGRLLSPLMGALATVSLFVLARRLFGETTTALLAVLLFSTSTEVLSAFVSFAMPQATGHFLVVSGLFAFLYAPAIFPLVALSISSTHAISTISLFVYVMIFGLFLVKSGLKKTICRAAPLLAFPIIWGVAFPSYNLPTWGVPMKLQDYISAIGPTQALVFVLFSFSAINPFSLAAVAMLLLTRGHLVPVRFVYHAVIPLSLSAAFFFRKNLWKIRASIGEKGPALALLLLSAFLLVGAVRYGNYATPLDGRNVDALRWIALNTAHDSTVLGYKDLSAIWLLYYSKRPTVLDGYSEAVSDPYRRMEDEYLAYSAGNLTGAEKIFSKYDVRYLFFNSAEEEIYKGRFNMTKFYSLPVLLNNGYAKVSKIE